MFKLGLFSATLVLNAALAQAQNPMLLADRVPDPKDTIWQSEGTIKMPINSNLNFISFQITERLATEFNGDVYRHVNEELMTIVLWRQERGERKDYFMFFGDGKQGRWAIYKDDVWHAAKEMRQEGNSSTMPYLTFLRIDVNSQTIEIVLQLETVNGKKEVTIFAP